MFDEKKNSKGFILGLLTGGILGSVIALLYAPKSGRKLRKNIAEKTDELIADAGELISNAKEKASDIMFDARKKAENLINEVKKKVDSVSGVPEKMLSKGKELVEEHTDRVKDAVTAGVNAYNEDRNKTKTNTNTR